jgi:hypothetical protein
MEDRLAREGVEEAVAMEAMVMATEDTEAGAEDTSSLESGAAAACI